MTPGSYLRQQQYESAVLAPDRTTGEIPAGQLRRPLRDASRFFDDSVPDDHFRRYVR